MADFRSIKYVVKVETADGQKSIGSFKTTLQSLNQSTENSKKSMEKLANQFTQTGQKAIVTVDATNELRSKTVAANKEHVKTIRNMNALEAEFAHLSSRLGKTSDEQEILNAQFRLGKNATKAQKDEVERLVTAYQKQRAASNQTQGSMRGLRGQAQNLGYQLQDVAVQAQMGTDALVIIGQQGSQLAAGFGATGALIGAGIAIVAAGIGVLSNGASAANAKTKELSDTTKTLADNYDKLNKAQKEILTRSLQESFKEKTTEANALQNKVNELNTALIIARREANGRFFDKLLGSDPDKINKELVEARASLVAIRLEREKIREQLKDPSGQQSKAGKAVKESKDSLDEYIKSLSESAATSKLSKREIAEYTLTQLGAKDADMQRASGILDIIEQTENQINADKKATAELKSQLSEQARLQQSHINTLAKYSGEGKLIKLKIQYEQEKKLLVGNHSALLELEKSYQSEKTKISGTGTEKLAEHLRSTLEDTDKLMFESVDRFSAGFGNAVANAVFESDNLGEAMANIFKDVTKNMVAFFAEWAAQKTALWLLDQTQNKAAKVSAAGSLTAEANTMALLAAENAYVGAVATPIVGMAIAPAAAAMAATVAGGMAQAVTAAASLIPALDKGGRIPSGGAAIVSEYGDELVGGTMVYNGSPNSLGVTGREQTARMTSNKNVNNITINSSGANENAIARAVQRVIKKGGKKTDTAVYDSMNRGKNNRGKRFA